MAQITFSQAQETFRGPNSLEDIHSIRNAYMSFLAPVDVLEAKLPDEFYKHQENMMKALREETEPHKKISLFYEAHNGIHQYRDKIVDIASQLGEEAKEQVINRFNIVNATIQRAYSEKESGYVHEEIDEYYQHVKDMGFKKGHIHEALFESPVTQHIENMWHNSNRRAKKTGLEDLVFYVESTLTGSPRDKMLIFSTYDNAGGFEDLNNNQSWKPPESTTGGGLGLTLAHEDVTEKGGVFMRENTMYGAAIHLAYPVISKQGILTQR